MNRTLLIVDDDQKTRDLLKTYLEKQQYDVYVAHDGASFNAEFERFKDSLSLVILDVMLPDTDGFSLCQPCPMMYESERRPYFHRSMSLKGR